MIREHDTVVLSHDVLEHGLKRGDIGAVVHCYRNGEGYEVEFVRGGGENVALLTLHRADVRPMQAKEILHVRQFRAA